MKVKIIFLLWLAIFTQLSCEKDQVFHKQEKDDIERESVDITTMATPEGGELKAAEVGPIRSALGQPEIEIDSFQLSVTGLVNSSFSLTWDEIQQWPAVYSDTMLMYCVEGWEVWGIWKGILVNELLQKASVKSNANHVLFHCMEGYTTALPISYIEKYNVMLAYEVNGKRLKKSDGFPLRLIAFGKFGYKWAKWVNKLTVMEKSQIGFWEFRGYSDCADVHLERRQYYEGPKTKPLDY